ncbi:hypothetical protein TL16_g02912 [Triparma laevis f. inornata]|uniref:TNFR-Cys domain-containing protein n=1 Tax=Triparma laevis f. inornata TaxID=1714386 RepID=A0A9W6ZZA7_9STRA|nr:hypothetical protein TL16_g02912 [Triparma laevis f. inornata]
MIQVRYSNNCNVCGSCGKGCCNSCWRNTDPRKYSFNCGSLPGFDTTGTPCAAGKYSSDYDSDCSTCADGHYSAPGAESCTACGKGKFKKAGSGSGAESSACLDCSAGKYSSAGSNSCSFCALGKYSSSPAAHACVTCGAGKYSGVGTSECSSCAAGKYLSDSSNDASKHDSDGDCAECEAGKSTNGTTAATECAVCSSGKYQNLVAQQNCVNCATGKYLQDDGINADLHDNASQDCEDCTAGQYSEAGAAACSDCSAGKHSISAGSSEAHCGICVAGKFQTATGSSACLNCPKGKYNNFDATDATNHDEVNDCKRCASGFYAADEGMTLCTQCDAGQSSGPGASACGTCSAGFECDEFGASSPCPAGQYSTGDALNCRACEFGYRCPGGTDRIACPQGSSQPATRQEDCAFCTAGKFQRNENAKSCEECTAGHFCPLGSTSPLECGSSALYCPTSSGIVQIVQSGYYSTGLTLTTRTGVAPCELGHKCVGGLREACEEGTFQDTTSKTSCKACETCEAGKFIKQECTTKSDRVCDVCPLGKASAGSLSYCEDCDGDGEYADDQGLSQCKLASPGKEPNADRNGMVSCALTNYSPDGKRCRGCQDGYHSSSDFVRCEKCNPGSYYDETGNACAPCPAGTSNSDGVGQCNNCEEGQFALEGAPICSLVEPGFKSSSKKEGQEQCEENHFSLGQADVCQQCTDGYSYKGATTCEICLPGKYYDHTKHTEDSAEDAPCTPCAKGRYSILARNIDECLKCENGGEYSDNDTEGASSCSTVSSGSKVKFDTDDATLRIGVEVCPAGRYSVGGSSGDDCQECETGFFQTQQGKASCNRCQQCEPGQYVTTACDKASNDAQCTDCPAGKASDDGLTCIDCIEGKWAGTKAPYCIVATAGVRPLEDRSGIETCPINTYSPGGQDLCGDCTLDGGHSQPGSASCDYCRPGQYFDAGLNQCGECQAGKKSEDGGVCVNCGPGKYSGISSSFCLDCAGGTIPKPDVNDLGCDSCIAGKSAAPGQDRCDLCDEGFVSEASAAFCNFCEAGSSGCRCKEGFEKIADKCECKPGYTLVPASGTCELCEEGYFKTESGNGACSDCSRSSVIRSFVTFPSDDDPPNSKLSCHCAYDKFRELYDTPQIKFEEGSDGEDIEVEMLGQCLDCPEGAICEEGTTLQSMEVIKGHWRSSVNSSEIVECYTPGACNQQNGTQCTDGHDGPLCNICKTKYSMGITGLCEECNYNFFVPPQLLIFCFFLLIFLGVFLLVGWIRRKQKAQSDEKSYKELNPHKHVVRRPRRTSTVDKGPSSTINLKDGHGQDDDEDAGNQFYHMTQNPDSLLNKVKTKGKILAAFWQVVSQYETILVIRFPPVFERFARWLSSLTNLDALKLVSFSCLHRTNFHYKLIFSTMTPILFMGAVVIWFQFRKFKLTKGQLLKMPWQSVKEVDLNPEQQEHKRQRITEDSYTAILAITYLVFASVSTIIFKTFHCKQYGDDPIRYLVADPQVDCDSGDHILAEAYATVMIFVYPIGITLLYTYLLVKNRKELKCKGDRHDSHTLRPIAFLWQAYEPRWWWFEIFENARRLMMTGGLVFVNPGSTTQIVVAMLVSILSIILYSSTLPYEHDSVDTLAVVSQWSIFFTLFGALLLRQEMDKEESLNLELFGVCLVIVNCMSFALVAFEGTLPLIRKIWVRACFQKHRHNSEIKGMTEDERWNPKAFQGYCTRVMRSTAEQAGWKETKKDVQDERFDLWVDDFSKAKVEWRCSYGDGVINEVRAEFEVDGSFEDVKRYLLRPSNKVEGDEAARNIEEIYETKQLKRYNVAKEMPFPYSIRDFLLEEWHDKLDNGQFLIASRSYVDPRRASKKTSHNLRRVRGKVGTFAFLVHPNPERKKTKVVFLAGDVDLRGFLKTDLIGRSIYHHFVVRVVDNMIRKFLFESKNMPESQRFNLGGSTRDFLHKKKLKLKGVVHGIMMNPLGVRGPFVAGQNEIAKARASLSSTKPPVLEEYTEGDGGAEVHASELHEVDIDLEDNDDSGAKEVGFL